MKLMLEEYEAVLDGGADAGAALDDPTLGVSDAEPALDDSAGAVDSVAAPEAAPTWAPSQEDWAGLTQTVQSLVQAVTPQPIVPAAPQLNDYLQQDPVTGEMQFTPEGLDKYISDRVAAGVNDRIGSYEPILNQTVSDRGEQLINQRLEQLQTEVGPFDATVARQIAEGLAVLPGAEPNAVLKQAAETARAYEKSIGEKAVEEYKKTLSNIGNAPREPGAAGSAVDRIEPRSGLNGYKDVEDAFLERHGISTR